VRRRKAGLVFFDLQLLGFQFLLRVVCSARAICLLARLGAFNGDDFSGHDILVFNRLLFRLIFLFYFVPARIVHRAQLAEAALAQGALAFELALRFDGKAGPGNRLQTAGGICLPSIRMSISVLFDAFESLFDS